MRKVVMKKWMWLPIGMVVLWGLGCSMTPGRIANDPFYESFFEKAQLIMGKEEVQIYLHLPDNDSRRVYIDDFWAKRDPDPNTEENEFKTEFFHRIDYANRWFRENRGSGRGWDTIRGRILLQLGQPDLRQLRDMLTPNEALNLGLPQFTKAAEVWVYYSLNQLRLIFADSTGFGEFKLLNWPAQLQTEIDLAKFGSPLVTTKGMLLRFSARIKDNTLTIEIPTKKISFQEDGDSVKADFTIALDIFRDYKKVGTTRKEFHFSEKKDLLLKEKSITFTIPQVLSEKGKHYIEIILEEQSTRSRCRDYLTYKN
jgi:GWxTD domain-containing protein